MGFTPGVMGTRGVPVYTVTPQTRADLQQAVDFAALVGTRRVGTQSQMDALTGAALFEGLRFGNTTDDKEYEYNGTGWEVVGGRTLTGAAPTMAATWTWGSGSKITRTGDEVRVHALITKSGAIAGAQLIMTLPVGYRPADPIGVGGALVSGGAPGAFTVTVTTDGQVNIVYLSNATSQAARLDFTFSAV